jgi:hypothetical protein
MALANGVGNGNAAALDDEHTRRTRSLHFVQTQLLLKKLPPPEAGQF